MRYFHWSIVFLISGISLPVYATETGYPTDAELRTLPPYCHSLVRSGAGSDEYKYWGNIVGPGFGHAHHFCQGLNLINRYYKAQSEYDRKYYLRASLPEFGYMISHAEPTSSLMPEVYLNRGIALSKLGRKGEAILDFHKALQLNPKLPRTYVVLSDLYVEMKLKDKALTTLTEGLKNVPESKMLQRRYVGLGGKKPFPEPYQPVANEQPASDQSSNDASPTQRQETANTKGTRIQPASGAAETDTAPSAPQPVVGTPGNPWCRFCPDPAPAPAPAKGQTGTPISPVTNP